ncbi:hypothetical protein TWF106_002540 [Orbilia oligospora]|uniref:BTB domain-containing protein n=1 Tax=Orbilia oligospora TaxID=2813651 RepID=A0A7C8USY4_ORBOL|nr:hypothetical protein TWF106_002540 [Orbilia oligospora]
MSHRGSIVLTSVTKNRSSSQYFKYSTPDVELIVGQGEDKVTVQVHEFVIGPPSEFFRAALNVGLKETNERKIHLPTITWVGMEEVLNWLYRREVWRPKRHKRFFAESTGKLVAVLDAVDFLQIPQLKDEYQEMLEEFIATIDINSPLLESREEGGCLAIVLHELYKIGRGIDGNRFYLFMKNLKKHGSLFPDSMNGFQGFREVTNELKEPNTRFVHDLCKAYSYL